MNNAIINDEIMEGKPLQIEMELQRELASQILTLNGSNYENICNNMRMLADVFELLEEHINEEYIKLKYNPMGSWFLVETQEKRKCSKCKKEMTQGYCIDNGLKYYCSDECLHNDYTPEEYEELYKQDGAYWTTWED